MKIFDDAYRKNKNYWGNKPSSIVKSELDRLVGDSVLDIGAGDGRNAVFLALEGFNVTCLDSSKTGLDNLMEKAKKLGIESRIKTVHSDFLDYDTDDMFDNVITNFTLHFVGENNIVPFLEKAAKLTHPGGINLIDDFTRVGPLAKERPGDFVTPKSLEEFYEKNDWKVLVNETRLVKVKFFENNGQPNDHEAVGFIAQKP